RRPTPPFARRAALLGLLALGSGWLSACSREPAHARQQEAEAFEVSELRYQSLAGHVLYPELAEDLGYLAPLKLRSVGSTYSGPQDLQSTATNDTDFSLAFNG